MYNSTDQSMSNLGPDSTFYCPYSMNKFQCPFFYPNRQKVEEYPLMQQTPPTSPPPNYTPKLSDTVSQSLTAVEFGAISPCIFRFTYLWLKNGEEFWSYIVFISRRSISGWRYRGGQWIQFATDLNQVKNFICS